MQLDRRNLLAEGTLSLCFSDSSKLATFRGILGDANLFIEVCYRSRVYCFSTADAPWEKLSASECLVPVLGRVNEFIYLEACTFVYAFFSSSCSLYLLMRGVKARLSEASTGALSAFNFLLLRSFSNFSLDSFIISTCKENVFYRALAESRNVLFFYINISLLRRA